MRKNIAMVSAMVVLSASIVLPCSATESVKSIRIMNAERRPVELGITILNSASADVISIVFRLECDSIFHDQIRQYIEVSRCGIVKLMPGMANKQQQCDIIKSGSQEELRVEAPEFSLPKTCTAMVAEWVRPAPADPREHQ
jgi:hypothetical protein